MSAWDEIRAAERRVEILRLEHALEQITEGMVYEHRITLSCLNGTVDVPVTKDDMRGLIERQLATLKAEDAPEEAQRCDVWSAVQFGAGRSAQLQCSHLKGHAGPHSQSGYSWEQA